MTRLRVKMKVATSISNAFECIDRLPRKNAAVGQLRQPVGTPAALSSNALVQSI